MNDKDKIIKQLQLALDEIYKKKSNKKLIEDYIFEAIIQIKNLNISDVIKNEVAFCSGCEHDCYGGRFVKACLNCERRKK